MRRGSPLTFFRLGSPGAETGYTRGDVHHTGPVPDGVTADLEALKLRLSGLSGGDLTPEQTASLASEISAIRLQLKRLGYEQEALYRELARRALET